jgi:hypothetical protein
MILFLRALPEFEYVSSKQTNHSTVSVTLAALNGNLNPAVRVLNLDIDNVSIPVGRASKTVSKGLQGARENAWFDSPVMSRDHAELLLDVDADVSPLHTRTSICQLKSSLGTCNSRHWLHAWNISQRLANCRTSPY